MWSQQLIEVDMNKHLKHSVHQYQGLVLNVCDVWLRMSPGVFVCAGSAVPRVPPPGPEAAPAGRDAGCGPAPAAHTGGQTQSGPGSLEREPAGCAIAHHYVKI